MNMQNYVTFLIFLFFTIIISYPTTINALEPDKFVTQYLIDSYQIEDGLPQNSVLSIVQTDDGFIWFSTEEGLVKYDGQKFIIYNKINSPLLKNNIILAISKGIDNKIWISGIKGDIKYYQNRNFCSFQLKDDFNGVNVFSILETKNNILFLGTNKNGIIKVENNTFSRIDTSSGLLSDVIYTIIEDNFNNIWIGTGNGLCKYNNNVVENYFYGEKIKSLAFSKDNKIYIGTADGLLKSLNLNNNTTETIPIVKSNDKVSITCIIADSDSNIWVGTSDRGLFRITETSNESLNSSNGLGTNSIYSLYEDYEKNLWIGTQDSGIKVIKNRNIWSYGIKEGLKSDFVKTVLVDSTGKLWIGTMNGLCSLSKSRFTSYDSINTSKNNIVLSLYEDNDKKIWIGSYDKGIFSYDGNNFKKFDNNNGFESSGVNCFYQDHDAKIWIATRNSNLYYYEKDKFTNYSKDNNVNFKEIRTIVEDTNNTLWLGTIGNGLWKIKDNLIENISIAEGLSDVSILSLFVDVDNNLWVATAGGGLNLIKGNDIYKISMENGLYDDKIFFIIKDSSETFWMASNKGLFSIKKNMLLDFCEKKINKISCTNYGLSNGMLTTECNGGTNPSGYIYRDNNNNETLFFSTIKGAHYLNTKEFKLNSHIPKVIIQEFLLNNNNVDVNLPIEFVYDKNNKVVIRYTATSYSNLKKVQFKYKLINFSDNWTEVENVREAVYTNLEPGEYIFEVIASNNDGLWNTTGTNIRFIVTPIFTQTIIFYIISFISVFMICLFLTYYLLRYKQRSIIKRRNELEEKVVLRTNELNNINSQLQYNINNLNIEMSNRIKAEKSLLESEKRYRNLVELSPDAIIIIDNNGILYYVNDCGINLLKIDRNEYYLNKPFKIYINDAYVELFESDINNVVNGKVKSSITLLKLKDSKGNYIDVEMLTSLIEYELQNKIIIIIRDLTEKNEHERKIEQLKEEISNINKKDFISANIIGKSDVIEKLIQQIRSASPTDANILILGETGTGKELVAKAIHNCSNRKDNIFVALNCGALPENLIESELFGYDPGAFTGANKIKKGKFEFASGGTLFLDEIGDLSLNLQVKLLRVLEEKTITRLGGNNPISIDVRIISATNKNLEEMVDEKTFRRDLYYRLNVISIIVKPLKDRKEDIPLLVMYFIKKFNLIYNKNITNISNSFMKYLIDKNWKGNVRELENKIEKCIIFSNNDTLEQIEDTLFNESPPINYYADKVENTTHLISNTTLKDSLEQLEKYLLSQSLATNHGNILKTAQDLNISRTTIYKKISYYKLHNLIK